METTRGLVLTNGLPQGSNLLLFFAKKGSEELFSAKIQPSRVTNPLTSQRNFISPPFHYHFMHDILYW